MASTKVSSVRPLRQLTETDCAATCLTMVLRAHGAPYSMAQVAAALDAGRDGATALRVLEAATTLGLDSKALRVPWSRLHEVPRPAITQLEPGHFVVLDDLDETHAHFVDPACGPRLHRLVDGSAPLLCLTFERHAVRAWAPTKPSPWVRIVGTFFRTPSVRANAAAVLLVSLVLQAAALIPASILRRLADASTPPTILLGLVIGHFGAWQWLQWARLRLLSSLGFLFDRQTVVSTVDHLFHLPLHFFTARSTGDLMTRIQSLELLREAVGAQVVESILDGLLCLGCLVWISLYAPGVLPVVVTLGALQVAVAWALQRRFSTTLSHEIEARTRAHTHLVRTVGQMFSLKATGDETPAFDAWKHHFIQGAGLTARRTQVAGLLTSVATGIQVSGPLLVSVSAVAGLWGMPTGQLAPALAAGAVSAAFFGPLAGLVVATNRALGLAPYLARLDDVLSTPSHRPQSTVSAPLGRVMLSGVRFGYDADQCVLRDVSLTIEPGQRVAIVGRSGEGKSTLLKLILGLYPPAEGTVTLDGFPAHSIDRAHFRKTVGVVTQDAVPFLPTIRECISRDASMSDDAIMAAAAVACFEQDIAQFPLGLSTPVGEWGRNLSGGQRQRLLIAAAVARRPKLLVLDEATGQLDAETERALLQRILSLGCGVLLVTHRLEAAAAADRVFELINGVLKEQRRPSLEDEAC
jgi:ABC-type bacteriocin/lantibiotic exporter with double-glycine peptidase domain